VVALEDMSAAPEAASAKAVVTDPAPEPVDDLTVKAGAATKLLFAGPKPDETAIVPAS
jgi:hypothetical protein